MSISAVPIVNLIPDKHIYQRRRAQWISRWIAVIAVTAIIVGIPGVYIGGSAVLTDSGMSIQIEQANLEYARYQQEIPVLRAQLNQLAAEQEVHDFVKNRIEWRDVFSVLVNSSNNDVRFRRISASGGGIEGDQPILISVDGIAPNQTVARAYVVDLENSAIFDSVELIETSREKFNDVELIRFRISLTVLGDFVQVEEPDNEG